MVFKAFWFDSFSFKKEIANPRLIGYSRKLPLILFLHSIYISLFFRLRLIDFQYCVDFFSD
mgnify:CR=1 FL=1